ncbi:MAG: glycerol-3-phosphate dehydrogenase C-terminal domain-containing protein, partial [Woeseiaceae bacterium]
LADLSERGNRRIIGIYGGRATDLLKLAGADMRQVIDADKTVLAAEVAFAIRFEYARNLIDLMHRRLMLGLSADQGEQAAATVAAIAARELGWDAHESARQLRMLHDYNARLRVDIAIR